MVALIESWKVNTYNRTLLKYRGSGKDWVEMTTIHIIVLLVTGVGTGFGAGLLGVGGAFIMTPVQYMVYTSMGLPVDLAIKMAFATDLMVILPTAVSGTWRYHRQRLVWWRAAIVMGSCSLLGAFGGATMATHLPGAVLKVVFGGIVLVVGIRMLFSGQPKIEEKLRDKPWLWVAWALPLGIIAGAFGIGGGLLVVPVMTLVLRFKMHTAIATSLAIIIFTSAGGVLGYIINGIGVPGLPAYSLGYVNLLAWFLLVVPSASMAQVGAITAHRLPAKQLRYMFIVIMFYMGLKMLGLFDWLGWPI